MSNLFKPEVKNHPNREGFDLSKRVLTTASTGMLLPLYHKLLEPGDYFEINVAELTRMQPLVSAAFARIDEHFDFFFVPCNDLWKYYNDWRMQIQNGNSTRNNGSGFAYSVPQNLPTCTLGDIASALTTQPIVQGCTDDFNQFITASYLTSLLGYGTDAYINPDATVKTISDKPNFAAWAATPVNILPLLAYQKIYADNFRNTRWESPNPVSFNVDYVDDNNPFIMSPATSSILRMRYANYKKDYFLGLFPNVSYGGVAIEPIGITYSDSSLNVPSTEQSTFSKVPPQNGLRGRAPVSGDTSEPIFLQANLNLISHRIWNILQRWREVYQMNDYRFKEQVKAFYGVDIPERRNRRSVYIDGFTNTIQIGEVVASAAGTAGTASSVVGQVFGKGVGASASNKTIKFTNNDEYGYIFCIYHAEPRIDYEAVGVHPDLQMVDRDDFYNPVFDKCDLAPVRDLALNQFNKDGTVFRTNEIIGYGSRYLNYKTDYDTIHLGFVGSTLGSWVLPYENQPSIGSFDYRAFKVSPYTLNPIMGVTYNDKAVNMPLLLNCNFDVKAVRNMSANSLPY